MSLNRYVRYFPLVPIIATVAFVPLLSACQSTMSVEEAKKVTASFSGTSFVPPPRTINDITAILNQQKLADPEAATKARARADQPPPNTSNPATLADFYYQRGLAAREIGRAKQDIDDLTRALEWAGRGGSRKYHEIAWNLALAELLGGSFSSGEAHLQEAIATTPRDQRGKLVRVYMVLILLHAAAGDFEAADAAKRQLLALVAESRTWKNQRSEWIAFRQALAARAQGRMAELKGRFAEAEAFYREALTWFAWHPVSSKHRLVEYVTGYLAAVLARQGRLLEAEKEARSALLRSLSRRGRYSTDTAWILRTLVHVISEQGRYAEAETLARATIDIYKKTGSSNDSVYLAFARDQLGAALMAQGRWQEALAEYEAIHVGMTGDPEAYEKYLGGNLNWALALLGTDQPDRALEILRVALERTKRLVGEKDASTAEVRGLLGMAYAARGDKARALREFANAAPILLTRSPEVEEESTSRPARDQRLSLILASYIGLLADINGTPLERQAGINAAAEAFGLADVVRGRSVQRALDASAARAAAKTPALADLVRKEQDAKKQISALYGILANALTQPTDAQDPKVLAALRSQIHALRRARQSLVERIEKEFPAYAELINPRPATMDQAQAALTAGEALIATLVTKDRTFVWAIPNTGEVAFAAAPLGRGQVQALVAELRKSLDPNAQVLGDIPAFDVALAHKLFQALLGEVEPGWSAARSLLIVSHGALGQLPFSVLPTEPVELGLEKAPLFSNYRAVPWLARRVAVTTLPSVASLLTLRSLPPGDPARRAFVGFGDPYFNEEQAREGAEPAARAKQERVATRGLSGLQSRGFPLRLRSSPQLEGVDSSQLAQLPRLPDTAEEVRSIALAMKADLTQDVFLGARANEQLVKTMELSGRRVIVFATHGLVPGDLNGLTQPALALSSAKVAGVEGDGLLTMEEILGLRLDADWVVLSACNTASGKGAGAEAVSGLGRAFFYAGARALLVSNWPVESTSARELTTDLFRRQAANPSLTRAKALQQTMNALIDGPGFTDPKTNKVIFSYAHPIFWAPFTLVGDGGGGVAGGN
ncbi:MAG: CHAT domain-containing protein [Candidatus Methylomirabilales bacterium]